MASPLSLARRVVQQLRSDVRAAIDHDPAARSGWEVVLLYPGVHAVWGHRAAHALWTREHPFAARCVAHANRFITGVEIHPGARLGDRVFIDHGMGVVIGETAVVGDGCLIYKGVNLGGTSLQRGPRHPRLGRNVVVGANACILGAIDIGDDARIGSGSVVVRAVPPGATVVGVPGRVVTTRDTRRSLVDAQLDHANLPDPVSDTIRTLAAQNEQLRARLERLEHALDLPPEAAPPHAPDDPFDPPVIPHTHGG